MEVITEIAQSTLNILNDFTLTKIIRDPDKHANDTNTINYIASTDTKIHLLKSWCIACTPHLKKKELKTYMSYVEKKRPRGRDNV